MPRLTTRIDGAEENTSPAGRVGGHRNDLKGIGLAAFSAVGFGTLAISAKFAYEAGAGLVPLLATRFWIATGLLLFFHLVTRQPLLVGRPKVLNLMLLGGLGYAFESALFFAALERAPAAVVGLIFYSYPLWTTAMGFASGLEPFRWRTVGALGLGSVGIALVFSLPDSGLAGPMLALSAAVAVAVYFILLQVVIAGRHSSAAAFWTTAGAAVTLSIASLVARQPMPAEAFVPAAGLGLASAVAFASSYEAIIRIGSSRTAIAAMLEPVTTLILAAVFLSERISGRVVVGAALVVAALPLLAIRRRGPAGG